MLSDSDAIHQTGMIKTSKNIMLNGQSKLSTRIWYLVPNYDTD